MGPLEDQILFGGSVTRTITEALAGLQKRPAA